MFGTKQMKSKRRVTRRFEPPSLQFHQNTLLEDKALIATSLMYTPGAAAGVAQAQANSTVENTSLPPMPFFVQNTVSGSAGGTTSSSFTGIVYETTIYGSGGPSTIVSVTDTETGISSTTIGAPSGLSIASSVTIATNFQTTDSVQADALGPYYVSPSVSQLLIDQGCNASTTTPYSFKPIDTATGGPPAPGTTVTATFTVALTATQARFFVRPTINFASTHLNVALQIGTGLVITDPSTGTTLVNDPSFAYSGTGGNYSVSVTDPVAATELINYNSSLITGPDGIFGNETAGQQSQLGWTFKLQVN